MRFCLCDRFTRRKSRRFSPTHACRFSSPALWSAIIQCCMLNRASANQSINQFITRHSTEANALVKTPCERAAPLTPSHSAALCVDNGTYICTSIRDIITPDEREKCYLRSSVDNDAKLRRKTRRCMLIGADARSVLSVVD